MGAQGQKVAPPARGDAPRRRAFTRLLWHVNRTPLRWGVKGGLSLLRWREKLERRRLGRRSAIDPMVAARAEQLQTEGYAMVDELVDRDVLGALARDADEKLGCVDQLERQQRQSHKGFWVSLLDGETHEAFSSDSVYVRFALQPRVVQLVTAVLGELPLLSYVLLTLSREGRQSLSYSQLWHRDHDDVRVLKLFTYLTDVLDDGDGPFTFLPGPAADTVGFTVRSHVPDTRVFSRIDASSVRVMKAPRLTTFVVETSRCLHMGSRMAPGHRRLMYTATFLTAPPMFPRNAPSFCLVGPVDRRARLLLGLPA
jgi:hypothetical protein